MKIIIFGVAGFLGTKLMNYLSKDNEIIGADINREENIEKIDATDKKEVRVFLLNHKPDIVVDTVALASSVACEKNPELAKKLNYQTAKNIAEACKEIGAKMIFISSSYVFDGIRGEYREEDVPSPTNEYARTKVMAEEEVLKLKNSLVLRIDIIYGIYKGKVRYGTGFIEEGVEVGYPDQIKKPLFVEDVLRIILELIQKDERGIFHLGGPETMKMIDFLKNLASLIGQENKIKIVDSSGWIVKSPKNSTLDISKINSLGIKTTPFKQALEIIKNQLL